MNSRSDDGRGKSWRQQLATLQQNVHRLAQENQAMQAVTASVVLERNGNVMRIGRGSNSSHEEARFDGQVEGYPAEPQASLSPGQVIDFNWISQAICSLFF